MASAAAALALDAADGVINGKYYGRPIICESAAQGTTVGDTVKAYQAFSRDNTEPFVEIVDDSERKPVSAAAQALDAADGVMDGKFHGVPIVDSVDDAGTRQRYRPGTTTYYPSSSPTTHSLAGYPLTRRVVSPTQHIHRIKNGPGSVRRQDIYVLEPEPYYSSEDVICEYRHLDGSTRTTRSYYHTLEDQQGMAPAVYVDAMHGRRYLRKHISEDGSSKYTTLDGLLVSEADVGQEDVITLHPSGERIHRYLRKHSLKDGGCEYRTPSGTVVSEEEAAKADIVVRHSTGEKIKVVKPKGAIERLEERVEELTTGQENKNTERFSELEGEVLAVKEALEGQKGQDALIRRLEDELRSVQSEAQRTVEGSLAEVANLKKQNYGIDNVLQRLQNEISTLQNQVYQKDDQLQLVYKEQHRAQAAVHEAELLRQQVQALEAAAAAAEKKKKKKKKGKKKGKKSAKKSKSKAPGGRSTVYGVIGRR